MSWLPDSNSSNTSNTTTMEKTQMSWLPDSNSNTSNTTTMEETQMSWLTAYDYYNSNSSNTSTAYDYYNSNSSNTSNGSLNTSTQASASTSVSSAIPVVYYVIAELAMRFDLNTSSDASDGIGAALEMSDYATALESSVEFRRALRESIAEGLPGVVPGDVEVLSMEPEKVVNVRVLQPQGDSGAGGDADDLRMRTRFRVRLPDSLAGDVPSAAAAKALAARLAGDAFADGLLSSLSAR